MRLLIVNTMPLHLHCYARPRLWFTLDLTKSPISVKSGPKIDCKASSVDIKMKQYTNSNSYIHELN